MQSIFQLSQFRHRHGIDVEIMSSSAGMGVQLHGDWDQDLQDAGLLFPLFLRSSHDYTPSSLVDAVIWAGISPQVAVEFEAVGAAENAAREAPLL
jgi:hypothetical protein